MGQNGRSKQQKLAIMGPWEKHHGFVSILQDDGDDDRLNGRVADRGTTQISQWTFCI